ncbi:bestrophin-like domain [Streptomyces vinaceus]|uniref:bestrophin-like domain n=1 Tax=Streptomyces vinaceus TaxID=1960 RepID=UPI00381427BC
MIRALEIFVGMAGILAVVLPHRSRPAWKSAALLVGCSVLLVDGVMPWAQQLFGGTLSDEDEALVGGGLSLVGTLFALMVGFVVVVVWQSVSDTESTVAREANALSDLERMSRGFQVEIRRQVHEAARTYARLVIAEEWPAMANNKTSARANAALVELWNVYTTIRPAEQATHLFAQSLVRLNELGDARRARLLAATSRVPAVMWLLIAADALAIIAMSFAYGLSEAWQVRLLMAAMVGTVAFAIFLVAELDGPFSGDLCVGPEPFELFLDGMQQIES